MVVFPEPKPGKRKYPAIQWTGENFDEVIAFSKDGWRRLPYIQCIKKADDYKATGKLILLKKYDDRPWLVEATVYPGDYVLRTVGIIFFATSAEFDERYEME